MTVTKREYCVYCGKWKEFRYVSGVLRCYTCDKEPEECRL